MNSAPEASPNAQSFFPDWMVKLAGDPLLTPGLKASYRQTLDLFLEFCFRRSLAPAVALAREFVELGRLEKAPSPQRLQEWKDALNWFFRRGRETRVMTGIPTLGRDDLGRTEWEAAMINNLRDAVAGARDGYSQRAGIAWAQGRRHDADLHARHEEAGLGSTESVGWVRCGTDERTEQDMRSTEGIFILWWKRSS